MKFVNYKTVFTAIFLITLALILKNTTEEFFRIQQRGSYLTELEKQLEQEQSRNKFLKERLEYVQTDEFIEEESRQKLGLVREGEFVVQEKFEPVVEEKIDEKLSKPNWQQWIDLFM